MRTSVFFRVIAFLFIGILLFTSCTPTSSSSPVESVNQTNTETSNQTKSGLPTEREPNITPESAGNIQPTTSETALFATPEHQATPTPIVENRLPPDQWREWPVVPELTGREAVIYESGQLRGNDPTHFSKVGDCQAIKEVLMGIYDQPDRYTLTEKEAYLQETIDHFKGSFNRDGQAVRGGFNAAAVLSPLWADPEICQAGETPIECEYRTHKPIFVIISLEVWWEGRTVERYEEYLRQILDFYIENGVVPILSTKADNVEGDHRINLATAKLAYEYHVPLWNFWRAVQSLPNHGIDPDRDGFHISVEAWNVRSLTALQALDAVWRGVRDQPFDESTPEPIEEQTVDFAEVNITPLPLSPPVPASGEKLIFSLQQHSDDLDQNSGIFTYDFQTESMYQLFGSGYHLVDISPNGEKILVSSGSELFVGDLNGDLSLITDRLAITDRQASAFWLPDGIRILVLTEEVDGQTLWVVDPHTNEWAMQTEGKITGIIKPTSEHTFYWYQGTCDPGVGCEDNTIWRTQEGNDERFLEISQATLSSDGKAFAWTETAEETMVTFYIKLTDQSLQDFIYLPGNRTVELAWGPFGNRVALLTVTRSAYSGKSSDARIFIIDINTMSYVEYLPFPGLNPIVLWHEDADSLMLTSTLPNDQGYQIQFNQMSLVSGLFKTLDDNLFIGSQEFITLSKLYWITP